jgi:hypothetical protein
MIACGRCLRQIRASESEYCWYCGGPLCGDCWERVGHCGHAEADQLNQKIWKSK